MIQNCLQLSFPVASLSLKPPNCCCQEDTLLLLWLLFTEFPKYMPFSLGDYEGRECKKKEKKKREKFKD